MSQELIPASIRNNNPGAMEPGFASKRFGSTTHEVLKWVYEDPKTGKKTPKTNRCATFPTHHHGAAAMFVLLAEGKPYRNKTIEEAIKTWCGGYWASEYLEHMYSETGLKPTSVLTLERVRDPDVAIPICQSIARWERGKGWPIDQLDWPGWKSAHDMAFGNAMAPAPTPDNDVPFQKPEGKAREKRETIAMWFKRVVGGALTSIGTYGVLGPTGSDVLPFVPPPSAGLKQTVQNLGAWGDAVPWQQWQMLAMGAGVFAAVAGASVIMQKVRNG